MQSIHAMGNKNKQKIDKTLRHRPKKNIFSSYDNLYNIKRSNQYIKKKL